MAYDSTLELGCTGMYFSVTKPWSVLLDSCLLCTDICKHSHLTASCLSVVASKLIRISSEGFWTSLSIIESREPWISREWHAPCKWQHINREMCMCIQSGMCIHRYTPTYINTHASTRIYANTHPCKNIQSYSAMHTHAITYLWKDIHKHVKKKHKHTHACTYTNTHPSKQTRRYLSMHTYTSRHPCIHMQIYP